MANELLAEFVNKFGTSDTNTRCFFAPGRVNLIGDHTDYTGGKVFPCAIDRGTTLVVRASRDGQFRFASSNFDSQFNLNPLELDRQPGGSWCNYPLGVIDQFRQLGLEVPGLEFLFSGNIPNGAGLSSSASILVATAYAINALTENALSNLEIAKLSQLAEWEYAGTQCGILDQFAVTMGKQGQAIELDCRSLDYRYVPLSLQSKSLVIANTNQQRRVSDSAYNDRVAECQLALELLKKRIDVSYLGEVSVEMLETHREVFNAEPVAHARARHVVTENRRVSDAVDALEANDFIQFGQLMNESHASLAKDFEVSSTELDSLVSAATDQLGVYGSRLTGAGFGGCTVSIVDTECVSEFKQQVGLKYTSETGLKASFYLMKPAAGVHEVNTDA